MHDLGPVSVEEGSTDHPCAGKQAALLALLSLHIGERVPTDTLAAAGWGLTTTVSSSSVENHMWRLRCLLEPRRPHGAPSVLVNVSGGYRLDLPGSSVDSHLFESLALQSADALDAGDPEETVRCSDEALALWRGAPYESLGHLTSVAGATSRLDELRGQVLEQRVDALLELGRVGEALAELESLVEHHPYREHLWARRMTALVSMGRTEEALTAYRTVREILSQELGIEPGEALRRAHSEALTGTRSSAVAGRVPVPVPVRGRRRGRPAGPGTRQRGTLIGRSQDVAALTGMLDANALVTVVGPGGCGKTRLAVEVAGSAASGFPDGVWFADLTTATQPEQVLDVVVSTLGLVLAGRDAAGAVVDHVVAGRLLLVLDNCEHVVTGAAVLADAILDGLADASSATASSVNPHHLPGPSSPSRVLVTSREPLEVPGEVVLRLAPLMVLGDALAEPSDDESAPRGPSPAATLFAARMGRPPLPGREAWDVERICRAVDGLPLALELAAARTRSFTVREVLDQVTQDPGRLSRLGAGGPGRQATLGSALDWSYRLLTPREQAVHRRLAVLPGPFTLPVASAVAAAADLDVHDVPAVLTHLEHRSLLVGSPTGSGRTVFRQLDTVRAHARQRLDQAGEAATTAGRRDEWVTALLAERPRVGDPAEVGWYDALDDGWPSVRATLARASSSAAAADDMTLLDLAAGLLYYPYYRIRVIEVRRLIEAWLTHLQKERPGPGAHPAVLSARLTYAGLSLLSGQGAAAAAVVADVLPHVTDLEGEALITVGERLVGVADAAWSANDFVLLAQVVPALRAVADRSLDPALTLLVRKVEVEAGLLTLDPAETAALAEEMYASGLTSGNLLVQWSACGLRAIAGVMTADHEMVTRWTDRLISVHLCLGPGGGGAFLEQLANAATLGGRPQEAIPLFAASQAEARQAAMPWPVQLGSDVLLDQARAALDEHVARRLWEAGSALTLVDVAHQRGLLHEWTRGT